LKLKANNLKSFYPILHFKIKTLGVLKTPKTNYFKKKKIIFQALQLDELSGRLPCQAGI
jgi:hypothetical protein